MKYKQNDLLLVKVRFNDSPKYKKRPAIVVSNNKHNENDKDIVIVPLTSKLDDEHHTFTIDKKDIREGKLKFKSRVRPHKITTVGEKRVIRKLGEVNFLILERIRCYILELIL